MLLVAFANIGTQGTGSYVNCMIVKSGLPKVSYKLLVIIAMIYVSVLTVWGGVEKYFGAFISLAAYVQGPIIGMILVDYFIIRKRKLSLKSAYNLKGHNAYKYTNGYNIVGLLCIIISCLITGSGFTAILGAVLYYLASVTLFKKYMVSDRNDLEII